MKKLFLILLFVFVKTFLFGQVIPKTPGTTTRGNSSVVVEDYSLSARANLLIPRFDDTTQANTYNKMDTCGKLAYTYLDNKLWLRACSPKRWIAPQAGSVDITSFEFFNDSTLIICYGDLTCDTIGMVNNVFVDQSYVDSSITNAITNIFDSSIVNSYLINDSTLVICNGAGVCDTINLGNQYFSYYFINDSTIVACDTPQVICVADTCNTQQVCDTIIVARQRLYIFQNGVQQVAAGIVEHGHTSDSYNQSALQHPTYLYSDYLYQILGARNLGEIMNVKQRQYASSSGSIMSVLHSGDGDNLTAIDYNNQVKFYTNYTDPFYGDSAGYMGNRIGYFQGTNMRGSSNSIGIDNVLSKQTGIFWHTLDTANTDGVTIFGVQTPKAIPLFQGTDPSSFYDNRIAVFKTDKDIQFPGYDSSARNDGVLTKVLGTDSDGNLLLGTVSGGGAEITIINDTTIQICSHNRGPVSCDTIIVGGATIQTVFVINDSTLLVCNTALTVCDTVSIPQTFIDRGFFDPNQAALAETIHNPNGNDFTITNADSLTLSANALFFGGAVAGSLNDSILVINPTTKQVKYITPTLLNSGSTITIINDTTITICSYGDYLCDTFNITSVTAQLVTILTDTSLLVCDTLGVCDTLFIPSTFFGGLTIANSLFVTKNGSDVTGLRTRLDKPFVTIQAAINAAASGDVVIVYPGTYDEQITLKNGVNIYLHDGVIIDYTSSTAGATIRDNAAPVTVIIDGYGTIKRSSASNSQNFALFITSQSSNVTVKAKLISSLVGAVEVGGKLHLYSDVYANGGVGIQVGRASAQDTVWYDGNLAAVGDYGVLVSSGAVFYGTGSLKSTSNSALHNAGGTSYTEYTGQLWSTALFGFEMSGGNARIYNSVIKSTRNVAVEGSAISKYGGDTLWLDNVRLESYHPTANSIETQGNANHGIIYVQSYSSMNRPVQTSPVLNLYGTLYNTVLGAQTITNYRFETDTTNIVAANNLTLGNSNVNLVSGATQITAITTAGWQAGSSSVFLVFSGAPLVKHNTAGGAGTATILLAGATDFQAAAGDVLSLVYDGTNWHETSRKLVSSSGVYTASEGLHMNGNDVRLGGTMTKDTTIASGVHTLTLLADSIAGDAALSIVSNSRAAASNAQKGLNISLSGTNSNASQLTYGAYITNEHTGTTPQNYGTYSLGATYGVYGQGGSSFAGEHGVYGKGGKGVYGESSATTTAGAIGVWGESVLSSLGKGVYGLGNFIGVNGQSTSGTGVYGESSTGSGVLGTTTGGGYAGTFLVGATTTIKPILEINSNGGTPSNGVGGAIDFRHRAATTSITYVANSLISKLTDVTLASLTSQSVTTGIINAVTDTLQKMGDYVTLTETTATKFAGTTVSTGKIAGGEIVVTVTASDATDFQARTLRFVWSAVNKAGTTTVTFSTPEESVAASTGTLTVTITATDDGSGVISFKADATSSLTQTTLRCSYQMSKNF